MALVGRRKESNRQLRLSIYYNQTNTYTSTYFILYVHAMGCFQEICKTNYKTMTQEKTAVSRSTSDQFQFSPAAPCRNDTSHTLKNLAFHSLLRWKMIILPIFTTSLNGRTFSLNLRVKGLNNILILLLAIR